MRNKILLPIILGMFLLSFVSANIIANADGTKLYYEDDNLLYVYNASTYELIETINITPTRFTIGISSSYCKSWFGGLIKKCEYFGPYDSGKVIWTIFGIRLGEKTEGEKIGEGIMNGSITSLEGLNTTTKSAKINDI